MGRAIQLKFLFANRDGLVVEVGCELQTPVEQVKAALLLQWPAGAGPTPDVGRIRLICMGLGILTDGKTLEQCRVPLFPTHPTPINVSVRETPDVKPPSDENPAAKSADEVVATNCSCVIQ
ncbi:hypothetical protein M885DRAFT_526911 [Pelagophyceae sp. CCMP2097]|nr:hypothetical protein M885DRAFT_526911 [Pelagophyceae sp. CCMP2097]